MCRRRSGTTCSSPATPTSYSSRRCAALRLRAAPCALTRLWAITPAGPAPTPRTPQACAPPPLQAFLTATHLGIAMEYASGGDLFERVVKRRRLPEDEARYFFWQLVQGLAWCHSQVCAGAAQRTDRLRRTLLLTAAAEPLAEGGDEPFSPAPPPLPTHSGRVPPRPQAGQHPAGGGCSGAAAQAVRLWLLQVAAAGLCPQHAAGHACLPGARGAEGGRREPAGES
jgi:hypothetical protein